MKENLIQTELGIDSLGFGRAESHLKHNVIPAIQQVIDSYNALQVLPSFNPEIWGKIVETKGQNVVEDYLAIVKKESAKFSLPTMRALALDMSQNALIDFKTAWNNLMTTLNGKRSQFDTNTYTLAQVVFNSENEPIINMDLVRDSFTLKIRNEMQGKIYEAGIKCEKELRKLHSLIVQEGGDFSQINWASETDTRTIFEVSPEGEPSFNPWTIRLT